MTYLEYRKERETEACRLPIFYAFSDAQLAEELTKRGFNGLEGASEIYRIGNSRSMRSFTNSETTNTP